MWFLLEMFLLPLGVWDGLRYFIVALSELPYNYLVISRFGVEGWSWVPFASVPGLCIPFTFTSFRMFHTSTKFETIIKSKLNMYILPHKILVRRSPFICAEFPNSNFISYNICAWSSCFVSCFI